MIKNVGALANVLKIRDLRDKVFYTLAILAIYRLGAHIPVPFVDRGELANFVERQRAASGLFQVVSLFSGKAFEQMSVFALGIMPYISVSIILQVLAVVIPRLQKLQQEGVLGQRKINRWTRVGTIFLGAFQGFGLGLVLLQNNLTYFRGELAGLFLFTTMMTLTAGCAFVMWLGERITDKGIGNGISLIIAVGIMAHYPSDASLILNQMRTGNTPYIWAPILVVLFVISTVAIILIQDGTRRIPMQHAKRVVGRRVMSGGTNYLPLKVNTAGVIPVIFSSALLSFPSFIASYLGGGQPGGGFLGNFFALQSPYNLYTLIQYWYPGFDMGGAFLLLKSFNMHIVAFSLLTGFFCYFYTAVVFNPDDVANNLKKGGSFIPGRRPGKPTSEYIDYVLTRITTVGAIFLVSIAVLPQILEVSFRMPYAAASFVGGTGLIIVVGVLLDTLKQIESQLLMRHYEGFALRKTSFARWR
ncbi:MAG: preprotein translocase subunit SecY [Candidatus Sumerlaeaceae bacterium]|nr:preprotein translocase subunit SecY [Candidatus Sumerlaeaceae bacterium]